MNEQEQKAAKALLAKLEVAGPVDVVEFANAYQLLTLGALNRVNAEATVKLQS